MQNKLKIISIVSIISTSILSFVAGMIVSKKRYSPKKVNGELFIDYTENKYNPSIYLAKVDSDMFTDIKYAVIGVNHVRK